MVGSRKKKGLCPCASREPYLSCCGRYIDGGEIPDAPHELMRSRYTAYAVGDVDYIVETTDPDGPVWREDSVAWRRSITEFARSYEFVGVDILESEIEEERGMVRFRAKLRRKRDDASFVEESQFVRRDGRWLYTSGLVE